MVRLSAVFIALCMMLIASSAGLVAYLRFGATAAESGMIAVGLFTLLAGYNTIAGRLRDRAEAGNQITVLSRSAGDLARQLAEFERKLVAIEGKMEAVLERSLATAQPLAAELEELSTLVKRLAESVAAHELALGGAAAQTASSPTVASVPSSGQPPQPHAVPPAAKIGEAVAGRGAEQTVPAFAGLSQGDIAATIANAIEANRIDLYLQPIVTLPQRKVPYYESLSRLKTDNGDIVAAANFVPIAEAGGLMPKLDHLTVLRCVQVVRRLLLKNREIGLFCNISGATLIDASFPQLLEFINANRAIAASLVFELKQSAVRAMGPIEHESLAAIAERGFRFSMDNLADLRVEPRELADRGFRFVKAPAALLLNRVGSASTDIHPEDLSDLLARYGIDLIAERIESESTVVDLLDYDVRFGQGLLFAPPRPVRAEALQDGSTNTAIGAAKSGTEPAKGPAAAGASGPGARPALAHIVRAASGQG